MSSRRAAKPGLEIVARAHSDVEVEHLAALGANVVIMGEREIARSMTAYAQTKSGHAPVLSSKAVPEGENLDTAKPVRQLAVPEETADSP